MKTFKVIRFPKSCDVADTLVLIATKSNGNNEKISLDDMVSYAKCQQLLYPFSNSEVIVSKISDSHLIIERDSEPALEIIEMEDIGYPTLDVYGQSSN